MQNRCGFPGSVFQWTIDSKNTYVRRVLARQLTAGIPYIALTLNKPAASAADSVADQSSSSAALTELSKVHSIGVIAEFEVRSSESPSILCQSAADIESTKSLMVNVICRERIELTGIDQPEPVIQLKYNVIREQEPNQAENAELAAYKQIIESGLQELTDPAVESDEIRRRRTALYTPYVDLSHFGCLSDYAACLATDQAEELQKVLAAADLKSRLLAALHLVRAEQRHRHSERAIAAELAELARQHEKQFLERLRRDAKQRAGGKESIQALIDKYRLRLKGKIVPPDAERVITEELNRLASIDSDSNEFTLTRNYVDWLTSMPFGLYSTPNEDLASALRILDEDHFGMPQVKDRVLELIATCKLAKTELNAKILCLYGPPGVGKTSIGRSIARALNRPFARFSVGGLDDVAEIKGHRRTYVGSMPGKVIQALKKSGAANPVILIDEIDKLGKGWRGDPAAALLELLDPEQNKSFLDHYMDLPLDLSRVLFLCTANDRARISGPLADRMEFIECAGYLESDKFHIAKRHLEASERSKLNVTEQQVRISDEAMRALISKYSREPGVRNLKKYIAKVYGKIALKMAQNIENQTNQNDQQTTPLTAVQTPIIVQPSQLVEYCGLPRFTNDSLFPADRALPIGVAHALAWNELGGSSMFIECSIAEPGRGQSSGVQLTGNIGEVMRESVSIAYTVAKRELANSQPNNQFFHQHRIHVHMPAGATPKDGPSAGITLVCAMISAATRRSLPNEPGRRLAMTGELSLTGRVLPIGGLREKLLAAKRAQVSQVIIPEENRKDLHEISDEVKEGIICHFVSNIQQVLRHAFPESEQAPNEPAKRSRKGTRKPTEQDQTGQPPHTEQPNNDART